MPEFTFMIDGFPLGAADPDYQIQLLINEDLETARRVQTAPEKSFSAGTGENSPPEIAEIRNQPKMEQRYPRLTADSSRGPWLLSILRRFKWNLSGGERSAEWTALLAEMIQVILHSTEEQGDPDFLALAEQTDGLAAHGCFDFAHHLEQTAPLGTAGPAHLEG